MCSVRQNLTPRVLICSAGIPHEFEGASLVLYFQYIRGLCEAGYDVYHLLLLEGDGWSDLAVSAYAKAIKNHGAIEIDVVRAKTFIRPGRFEHSLDLNSFNYALVGATSFKPDVVVAFDILPAWITSNIEAKARIVWLGDFNFQTFWWHAIYSISENIRALRALPAIIFSCRAWRKIYKNVLKPADHVIVASGSSVEVLSRLGITAEYEPYPWPASLSQCSSRQVPSRPKFMFFGNLVGLGSRSALHFMIDKLYPRLIAYWGSKGFSILLAGRGNLPDWFLKEIQNRPEFIWLGYVDAIDELMRSCHAVVAPISVPVGNRSRIITAMAGGALIIAHKNASLGNPDLVDGQNCYLARNADAFVDRMKRAVESESESMIIIQAARDCYEARFSPKVAVQRLVNRVNEVMAATFQGSSSQ